METVTAAHEDAEKTEDPLSPIGEGPSGTCTPLSMSETVSPH